MTREEAIANHRKLWNWLADETERRRSVVGPSAYFNAIGVPEGDRPFLYDYCCGYDNIVGNGNCNSCPIEWPTGKCWYKNGLHTQWSHTGGDWGGDWRKAAELARRIANLPNAYFSDEAQEQDLFRGVKTINHQYVCSVCKKHMTLPHGSKYCPVCGGSVESKAEIFANEKAEELKRLLPVLEEKYNEFVKVYVQFKTVSETLRTYAARGLIDREKVVDFKLESLTEIFYKSRKKRRKQSEDDDGGFGAASPPEREPGEI